MDKIFLLCGKKKKSPERVHAGKRLWVPPLFLICTMYLMIPLGRPVVDFLREMLPFSRFSGMLFFLLALCSGLLSAYRVRAKSPFFYTALLGLLAVYLWAGFTLARAEEKIHLLESALLSILILRALKRNRTIQKALFISFFLTLLTGFLSEVLQYFVPGRVYDPRDLLFTGLGGAFGLLLSLVRLPLAQHQITAEPAGRLIFKRNTGPLKPRKKATV